jgi:hypothetical protein
MAIAALCELVALIGKSSTDLLSHATGRASWLVVPAIGVGVAVVTASVEAYGKPQGAPRSQAADRSAHAPRPATSSAQGDPRRREGGRTSLAFAVLVFVLVLGLGGFGVSEGTRSAVATAHDQTHRQDAKQPHVSANRKSRNRPRPSVTTPTHHHTRQTKRHSRRAAPPPPPPRAIAPPPPPPRAIAPPPPPPIQAPPPPPARSTTVPDVTDFSGPRAAGRISDAGLRWEVEHEQSDTVPFGRVIRTDPPAGTGLPRDSLVTIYQSDGASFG